MAAHVDSPLFLAHVRAAIGSPVQDANCNPVSRRRWLSVHNGFLADFQLLGRDLIRAIDPERFADVHGSAGTEVVSHLSLTFGPGEPIGALEQTVVRLAAPPSSSPPQHSPTKPALHASVAPPRATASARCLRGSSARWPTRRTHRPRPEACRQTGAIDTLVQLALDWGPGQSGAWLFEALGLAGDDVIVHRLGDDVIGGHAFSELDTGGTGMSGDRELAARGIAGASRLRWPAEVERFQELSRERP